MAHRCYRCLSESLFCSITQRKKFKSHCFFHRSLLGFCRFKSEDRVNGYHWFKTTLVSSSMCHVAKTARQGVYQSKSTLSSSNETSTPTVKTIENYLKHKEIKFSHGHTTIVSECPFCPVVSSRINKNTGDNNGLLTLFVNKTTGSHVCNSCGTSGTWKQLKLWMSEKKETNKKSESHTVLSVAEKEKEKVKTLWEKTKPFGDCKEILNRYITKRVEIQTLSPETLKFYKVHTIRYKFAAPDGKQKQQLCFAFPWYDYEKRNICGVKLQKIKMKDEETPTALEPRHGSLGIFGWHTVSTDAKEIVVTADEFDAMAVCQATSTPAISLPLGLSSLPPEVLPHLEQFEKIVLWFGNDVRSRQASNKFARKLNIKRCHVVRMETSGPTSAIDALRKGHDLKTILSTAQAASHKQIVTFQQLRDEVYSELCNADQVAGIKWSRFPKLSEILKGHRRGELTVFTGPTGAGKTTLLSELSVDLCVQGVNTLWGSFEVRNVRLAKTMLKQFSGLNLEKNLPQYNYWAEKFEMLPMYFMNFYGAQNLKDVLETMSHAAYVYDIENVIVDNLQFMISNSYSPDRFYAQNVAIAEFRNFATAKNVHVTLVIHPRKESDDAELQTASIFGSAKASQEADNVIILQDKKGKAGKYLQVTKNRFDGTLGKVYLDFNREALTMSSYQANSKDVAVKKENKGLRSVNPPKAIGSNIGTTRNTKAGAGEQIKPVPSSYDVGSKSATIKQKGSTSGSRDHRVSEGSTSTHVVSNNDLGKTKSRIVSSNVSKSQTKKNEHESKGTALNTKATRFNSYSTKKPVLTGQKISVKQLDVDNAYLQ